MLNEIADGGAPHTPHVEVPDRGLQQFFSLVLLAAAAYLLIFPPHEFIELWDESHYLVNALEMTSHGHWLVPTYNDIPDHWYSKPPLFVWAVASLMHLHVPPLVALRLPSGAAGFATILAVFLFCRNILARPVTAVFSALILTSANLFWSPHMALTGDMDAMLCLWTAIYCLGFWIYVENAKGLGSEGLLAAGIALALAILTKGIAGVLALPGLFVFLILSGHLRQVFSDWKFWATLLAAFATGMSYYAFRERVDPGYVQSVWWNELAGRFGQVNEGHGHGPFFYPYRLLLTFEPGLLLIPSGMIALLKNQRARSVLLFSGVTPLVLLLVLTKSATKINYYCAPVLPLISIFSGIGLYEALTWFNKRRPAFNMLVLQRLTATALTIATVVVVARLTVMEIHRKNRKQPVDEYADAYGIVLNNMARGGVTGPVFILDNGAHNDSGIPFYNPIPEFYARYESAHSRMSVSVEHPTASPPRDSWVLSCDPKAIALLPSDKLTQEHKGPSSCIYARIGGK